MGRKRLSDDDRRKKWQVTKRTWKAKNATHGRPFIIKDRAFKGVWMGVTLKDVPIVALERIFRWYRVGEETTKKGQPHVHLVGIQHDGKECVAGDLRALNGVRIADIQRCAELRDVASATCYAVKGGKTAGVPGEPTRL